MLRFLKSLIVVYAHKGPTMELKILWPYYLNQSTTKQ